MAVAPTGAIYKALKFDNVSSRTYGVYITGEAVYNAPERDVEMITIPGRSGSFALDNGRFENIEVSYPAGIYADTEADFRQAISDFRNFLCSRKGYVRLQDEYNPDEYRMAVYKSGLDVDPAQLRAGEFKLVFDCKPQRWLTSGETAVTVTSGDTLTNPTLFEASPLLEATGSGAIQFNGYDIDFAGIPYGEVELDDPNWQRDIPITDTCDMSWRISLLDNGDTIYPRYVRADLFEDFGITTYVMAAEHSGAYEIESAEIISSTNTLIAFATVFNGGWYQNVSINITPDLGSWFNYGTAKTVISSAVCRYRYRGTDYTETLQVTTTYDGDRDFTIGISMSGTIPSGFYLHPWRVNTPYIYGYSTRPMAGVPIYIDCDLGEAYYINDGEYVSLNQQIDLGSELPKLASGSNTVTFDNTITELKVTPRWWKV